MSICAFEHPLLGGLLGDEDLSEWFSLEREIDAMLRFETALARAQEDAGLLPAGIAEKIRKASAGFTPDVNALNAAAMRDGVSVPQFVQQLRNTVGEPAASHVHFGATSQDVVDTALVIRLKPVVDILASRLLALIGVLDAMQGKFGSASLMARTRTQRALPITVAHKLKSWADPLRELLGALGPIKAGLLKLQLGGPVGMLEAMGPHADEVAARLALDLGLANNGCWHTNRLGLVSFAGWLSQLCAIVGKIGQDVMIMSQNEIGEVALSNTGGSSAMAHKNNPVSAEILVSLARFSAALGSAMQGTLVHENERSGAAWTVEWMVLPQMVVAAGSSLRVADQLLNSIETIGTQQ